MKIDIDFVKGLVQSATGNGFAIDSKTRVTATTALDATTFLTIVDNAFTIGNDLTLPATATTGAIKLIVSDTGNHCDVLGTNCTTGDIRLTAVGDWVLAVFDGSSWVVLRSLG